jgi:P27 family predicted phage terminase small subunit
MAQVVNFDKMNVGRRGGGKHWTKDEIAKRQVAAQKVQRPKPKKLKMPVWLDPAAAAVWRKTMRDLSGLDILDKVDEDMLATYCDAVARHREVTVKVREDGYVTINSRGNEAVSPYVQAAQSYARIIMQYADKLGLNPNSRARLAKKIADEEDDPNGDLFD